MIGTPTRTRRALAFLLAGATAALVPLVATPTPAAAADVPRVSFTMTSLSMSGRKADDTVTLEGVVTNTGSVPAYGVQVILWRSRDAIRDLATLRRAGSSAVLGSRLPISPDTYVVVSTSTEAFAAGQSEPVTLRATLGDLGFDTRGAAFPFGADVIAGTDATGADFATVGQLRTFVAIPGKAKVPVTSIVLLANPPTKIVDNLFRDDSLAAELTGRLSTLLDAAAQPGMSWLVDPALVDEVRDMSDGYSVVSGNTTVPGTGEAAATAWLAQFRRLDTDAGGRTLFANPDINGARRAGDSLAIARSERAAAKVDGLDDLPLVVVPAATVLVPATASMVARSGADAVIASNTAVAGAVQAGAGRPRVLGASAAVPGASDLPPTLRSQLAVATSTVAGERGEVRVLRTPDDVAQDAAAMTGAFTRRDLRDLLDSTPSVTRARLAAASPPRLSADEFRAVNRLETDFTEHAELAPDSMLTAQSDAAVSRAASSAWAADRHAFEAQLDGTSRLVGLSAVGRSVSLDASPRFVMSSRTNQFPMTITNHYSEKIQVKVVVEPEIRGRLTVPNSELVTVAPGQSVTVNIRPEATSNGLVIAKAHLATQGGRRVTADTTVTVEVTDLGVVAWIIVGASGLVLVTATAWRIRQVRRRSATPATPAPGAAA